MIKVMFVCHGNICRSPMAEFVLRKMINDAGLNDHICVSSSATSSEEIWNGVGNPVYPPAREELKKHGIACEGKRAVQLCRADREKYDLFVCMDDRNIINARRILGDGARLYRLLDFTPRSGSVADPWYSGNFATAYRDIEEGCRCLLEKLKTEI